MRGLNFTYSTFLIICVFAFGLSMETNAQLKSPTLTIVIDAGHGGKDPGKHSGASYKMHEKEINLIIAKRLGELLQQKIPFVKVLYTRNEDETLELNERVAFANERKADYFISLHCDSNPIKAIYGTKSHIHNQFETASKNLAVSIQNSLVAKGRNSRGVMDAYDRGYTLHVLKYTEMPSVLIEMGFLSNPYEEMFLNSEKGQETIAKALSEGIQLFLKEEHPTLFQFDSQSPYYKVQILATSQRIALDSPDFKKLGMKVEEFKFQTAKGVIYKYMVGKESNSQKAKTLKEKLRDKGFADAFLVSFAG
jgi:N-acetylmuramoyl-L-alanine amidase